MVQQGRLLSAALSGEKESLKSGSRKVISALNKKHDARLRVIDARGTLLADSSTLGSKETPKESNPSEVSRAPQVYKPAQENLLYRLATLPVRIYRKIFHPPAKLPEEGYYSDGNFLKGKEVQRALTGYYGSATRITGGGQRSVTLFSALPVKEGEEIVGVVLVSQSTYRILRDLYTFRLEIIRFLFYALLFSLILSFIISKTITSPIRKLIKESRFILGSRKTLKGIFPHSGSQDEIGDLSRTLTELTGRLDQHISFIESFASDVSHEFKNPLASIKSATELAMDMEERDKRNYFLNATIMEVHRLEKLINSVKEVTRIDAEEKNPHDACDPVQLISGVLESFRMKCPHIEFHFTGDKNSSEIPVNPDRLVQVLENLICNAVSFSSEGGKISVNLENRVITVSDEGPGIPPEILDSLFNRFFSHRTDDTMKDHSGLGLSIVKSIIDKAGGKIIVKNLVPQGAEFSIIFP